MKKCLEARQILKVFDVHKSQLYPCSQSMSTHKEPINSAHKWSSLFWKVNEFIMALLALSQWFLEGALYLTNLYLNSYTRLRPLAMPSHAPRTEFCGKARERWFFWPRFAVFCFSLSFLPSFLASHRLKGETQKKIRLDNLFREQQTFFRPSSFLSRFLSSEKKCWFSSRVKYFSWDSELLYLAEMPSRSDS